MAHRCEFRFVCACGVIVRGLELAQVHLAACSPAAAMPPVARPVVTLTFPPGEGDVFVGHTPPVGGCGVGVVDTDPTPPFGIRRPSRFGGPLLVEVWH
jgi:hypothetical protein